MTRRLAGALLLLLGCEDVPAPRPPPRVLAVDLLDAQDLTGGQPAQRRLYAGAGALPVPDSGPELSLRLYLSAPLSAASLAEAPTEGLLVRDSEGGAAGARSFRAEAPDGAAPPGSAQALSLVPDLRSGRSYALSFDRAHLVSEGGERLAVPPVLRFRTARRFVVLRADPPDGARLPAVSQIRLHLSSVAHAWHSNEYGVLLTAGGRPQAILNMLSANRRQLTVEPLCPLPKGDAELQVTTERLQEDDTRLPLAAPWHQRLTVTEDPGPCPEAPDMGAPDL